jgi:glycosyltransferase involved in cell wall biosynthesis
MFISFAKIVLAMLTSDITQDTPVTILLSTYNGEKFLSEQLASLLAQSHKNWRLVWRDDGSSDHTVAMMHGFTAEIGADRCMEAASSGPHYGAGASFLRLLAEAPPAPVFAFADQDDVWLPEKLSRAVAALAEAGSAPALYCARQFLVDENLRGHKLSVAHSKPPGFPASLTQNIANGNTLVMNRAAAALVTAIPGPVGTIHDWWCYIVVTACGGKVIFDLEPQILYRLHKHNMIGRSGPLPARAIAAMRRGSGIFMTMMRRHANTLSSRGEVLSPAAARDLAMIQAGLEGRFTNRFTALRCERFSRRTALENILFRYWFITG